MVSRPLLISWTVGSLLYYAHFLRRGVREIVAAGEKAVVCKEAE